jgi:ribose transport system substrate-binding protein
VGFDTGTELVTALKAGDITALMVQDPFRMGYLGVKNAVDVLRGQKVAAFVDTGVTVATAANLEQPAVKDLLNPPLDQYLK